MTEDTFAAIDIGSNAIRLLISYVEHGDSTEFKKAAFIRVPVRLGEDVFTKGHIGQEKLHKLDEAMQGFAHLIEVFGVKAYRACATSAMREAENREQVVERIHSTSGIAIEIISGKEEAETIFSAGDIVGLMDSDKRFLYVDVGGGSTELTVYSKRRAAFSESFPLGTVRMLSGATDKSETKRFKECLHHIRKEFGPVAIVGSGGNINKAHKMLTNKDKEPLHYVELKLLFEELKHMTYDERMERFGLNYYRADVIMPAIEIFLTTAHVCHIDEIIVPKIGLADGIVQQLYRQSFN